MCVSCYIIRLATGRPLGERSEPFLAAKRPTASDEVARGRLVSREGLPFAFRAKIGSGVTRIWVFRFLRWRNVSHRRSEFVYSVRKLSLTMILGES